MLDVQTYMRSRKRFYDVYLEAGLRRPTNHADCFLRATILPAQQEDRTIQARLPERLSDCQIDQGKTRRPREVWLGQLTSNNFVPWVNPVHCARSTSGYHTMNPSLQHSGWFRAKETQKQISPPKLADLTNLFGEIQGASNNNPKFSENI